MSDDTVPAETDAHPDDAGSGINRQVVLGGVVVALTLAIAAWLAYGVVQRSATSPRAAGLVPDGSSGHGTAITTGNGAHARSTTTSAAATTTTPRKRNDTKPSTTATFGSQTPAQVHGVSSAALWQAYSSAWINECKSIWAGSTNGKLYDPDDPGSFYTVADCTRTLDQLFLTANVTSVAAARREGASDAASFTAQLTLSSKLCAIDPATDQTTQCWNGP